MNRSINNDNISAKLTLVAREVSEGSDLGLGDSANKADNSHGVALVRIIRTFAASFTTKGERQKIKK